MVVQRGRAKVPASQSGTISIYKVLKNLNDNISFKKLKIIII